MRYIFFGTPDIAVTCLKALVESGQPPEIVVTQPDRPAGRGNVLTPPAVKVYAESVGIEVVQVEKITDDFIAMLTIRAAQGGSGSGMYPERWDCFVLVAFGMILPQPLLDLPRMGTLNMHPSLLPKLRGPSPIRTALLTNNRDACGVTIMLIDNKMDHGPILAQTSFSEIITSMMTRPEIGIQTWPLMGRQLDGLLSEAGGKLLAETLPRYLSGDITPHEQNHSEATLCRFIEKTDAELDLSANPYTNYLKICAYDGWPSAYTYVQQTTAEGIAKSVRVKIISAHMENNNTTLVIDTCIPEGKKEMQWSVFMRTA